MAAEDEEDLGVNQSSQSLPFLEVVCKSSTKIRRFSAGTEAGFAVDLINKKLLTESESDGGKLLLATHIEAVKGEEEPVSFGPRALLVDYGPGWKLQTAIESYGDKGVNIGTQRRQRVLVEDSDDPHSTPTKQSPLSFVYIGKILLAFALLFAFGLVFTLALENLPNFISYISDQLD